MSRMIIQPNIELGSQMGEWNLQNGYANKQYYELDNSSTRCYLAMSTCTDEATWSLESTKKAETPSWFDRSRDTTLCYVTNPLYGRKEVIITGIDKIPEKGGLKFNVFHAFRFNAEDDRDDDLSFCDGYGESKRQIEQQYNLLKI